MKVYDRICLKDWQISDKEGNTLELKRGHTYTTAPHPKGVFVFSRFWVVAPTAIFEPGPGELIGRPR